MADGEVNAQFDELMDKSWKDFAKIPAKLHPLCPKIDDDDAEDYDAPDDAPSELSSEERQQRIQDGKERVKIAYWASLVLSSPKDKSGARLVKWVERMEQYLSSCDKCVLNWHMGRKAALAEFSECVRLNMWRKWC